MPAAQSTYDTINWLTSDVTSRYNRLTGRSDTHPDAMRQTGTAVEASRSAWRNIRSRCATDLAHLGFDC